MRSVHYFDAENSAHLANLLQGWEPNTDGDLLDVWDPEDDQLIDRYIAALESAIVRYVGINKVLALRSACGVDEYDVPANKDVDDQAAFLRGEAV